jgi:hypothetical protein
MSEKIYHIKKLKTYRILARTTFLAGLAPWVSVLQKTFSGFGFDPRLVMISLSSSVIGGLIASFLYIGAGKTHLSLSEDYLTICDFLYFSWSSTRWQDIAAIEVNELYVCLHLKCDSIPQNWFAKRLINLKLIRPDVINLGEFSKYWRTGELKEDFKLHIPNLALDG